MMATLLTWAGRHGFTIQLYELNEVVVLDIAFAEPPGCDEDDPAEANVGAAPDADTCVLILDRDTTVLVGHYPEAMRCTARHDASGQSLTADVVAG